MAFHILGPDGPLPAVGFSFNQVLELEAGPLYVSLLLPLFGVKDGKTTSGISYFFFSSLAGSHAFSQIALFKP